MSSDVKIMQAEMLNDLMIAAQDNRRAACDLLECLNDLGESGEIILSRFIREKSVAERNNCRL